MCIHGQMYLGVESPFCTIHGLSASAGSRCMRMNLTVTGIYQKPFKIRHLHQLCKNFFPDSPVSPATKTTVSIFPVSVHRRKNSPVGPCTQYPENSADKQSVIFCLSSPDTLPAGEERGQQTPYVLEILCRCITEVINHRPEYIIDNSLKYNL